MAAEFFAGNVIQGRYLLHERIGRGGVGIVFKAHDLSAPGRMVALKVLVDQFNDDDDPTVLLRFKNEVAMLKKVPHPHIVEVYDIGQTEGGFNYMALEYVDGGALSNRIPRTRDEEVEDPIDFNETLVILRDIATAVGHAHAQCIVHRDLKPDNVLLSSTGGVKVADFGLARIMKPGFTITDVGHTVGTPHYMAPEQIAGEREDARADIYSLGIIAFQMVNGFRPFDHPNADGRLIMMLHLTEPLPEFIEKTPPTPDWFQSFVEKCTMKNPASRYQSMAQVVSALERRMRKRGLIQDGLATRRSSAARRFLCRLFGDE